MSTSNRLYQILLTAVSLLMLTYALWRFSNVLSDIRIQGMIPQLLSPLLSIAAEVFLLFACVVLLAVQSKRAIIFGLAHAGLWLILLLISLPVHLPLARDSQPVTVGRFSQAALSQQILAFELGMLISASLLGLGIAHFIARTGRVTIG